MEYNSLPTAEVISNRQRSLPVDVRALAQDFNIKIDFRDLNHEKVAGKLIRDGGNYRIVVNSSDSQSRQRFTLAHEVAHYILHRDLMGKEITDDVMYRSKLSDAYETQANRLAAEILLPAGLVRKEYARQKALAPLAGKFGVSVDALKIRLKQLGLAP